MQKPKLIILTGPTSAGKTKLSVLLAKAVGGEIISADSMQVYRRLNIGSGKIKTEEMEGVTHHLLDVLEPTEEFHVVLFQQMAREAIAKIYDAGHIPIIVGGTGFYIQSVLYDIDFTEQAQNKHYRERLQEFAKKNGAEALHGMLREVDAEASRQIHANNIKRVIRALEFYHFTGRKISQHNEEQRKRESPYQFAYFVLTDDREQLYARIDKRVDQMIEDGLVGEVENLLARGCQKNMTAMQGLGYKEIVEYFESGSTLEEAVYKIKRDTRHFAKRQLTWFKRERDVIWLDRQQYPQDGQLLLQMLTVLKEKEIIGEIEHGK